MLCRLEALSSGGQSIARGKVYTANEYNIHCLSGEKRIDALNNQQNRLELFVSQENGKREVSLEAVGIHRVHFRGRLPQR